MRPSTDPGARRSLTSPGMSGWLEAFLACRGVERPDGRALYAYRCTDEEFGSLAEALSRNPPRGGSVSDTPIRAFVLYAAEWWQRKYDGRHWAWEPLLGALDELTRDKLNEELLRIWRETGTTIIFVTHSVPEAAFLGEKCLVLSAHPGRVREYVDVGFPSPRVLGMRDTLEFVQVTAHLRSLIEEAR